MTNDNRISDWAADASDDEGSAASLPSEVDVQVDEFVTETKYRASFVEHPSTQSRTLYSISGVRLVDDDGNDVNVWTRRMQDMFDMKKLYHGHVPGNPGGFGWFATSRAECKLIGEALETGYVSLPGGALHIYPDEKGLVPSSYLGRRAVAKERR